MKTRATLLLLSLLSPALACAQQLTLFEATDAEPEQQGPRVLAPQPNNNSAGAPAFSLRGTSRFGDQYRTVLVYRSGQEVVLSWQPGQRVPVPGYESFSVTNIDGRQVTLNHPGQDACIASQDLGVSCQSNTLALLSLSSAKPLPASTNGGEAPQTRQAGIVGQPEPGTVVNSNGQQVFINPFSGEPEVLPQLSPEEQAARAQRQATRRERLSQFEPERISDEDIPAGMQRVRTPFGDRLVPIRE